MYSLQFEQIYPIAELKRRKGVTVTAVDEGGAGEAIGLVPGDRITVINGNKVRDYLDFQFYSGGEDFIELEVIRTTGKTERFEVELEEGEIWGLDFEQFAPRQCGNECLFCFCEQNPDDARPSLFFRDEDVRLSFLHGNYTTMTTLTEEEFNRIVEQRLSPQYVSVHATDPEVRRHLLGRNKADDILGTMKRLLAHDIELHAQIVLCPKINDGEVLKQTVHDLADLYEKGVTSVAIVPLGLTKHHKKRHLLTPTTDEWEAEIIELVTPWQKEFRKKLGTTFAFLGDEFYIRAGKPIPGPAHYGPYPQIEDGVGMVRRFQDTFRKTVRKYKAKPELLPKKFPVTTVATGSLFASNLKALADELNATFGTKLHAVGITNEYFGPEVNVAGLVTGSDIYLARESFKGKRLLIPSEMVMGDNQIFLDNMTLAELSEKLGMEVRVVNPTGNDFVETALLQCEA
jgi:putative radical SAM enzyme (TIGR03279 family)